MPVYSNGLISNIRRMSNVQRSTSLTNVAAAASQSPERDASALCSLWHTHLTCVKHRSVVSHTAASPVCSTEHACGPTLHHHQFHVADEGRRVVAPPCPRSTARLQRSPIGRVESFRSWSTHFFRGRPGGRRHVRSGGRLSDTLMWS